MQEDFKSLWKMELKYNKKFEVGIVVQWVKLVIGCLHPSAEFESCLCFWSNFLMNEQPRRQQMMFKILEFLPPT